MNKLRLAAAFVATAVACAAVSLTFGGGPSDAQGPSASKPSQVREVPRLAPELEEWAREETARREEALARPEAVAARRESGSVFSALGPVQAKDLARETFGEAVTGSRAPGPRLGRGERVVEYVGDRWAKVDRGEGEQPAVVQSMLPMLAKDEEGKKAPVSLDLVDAGSFLEPANPLVGIEIERDASTGVRLADVGVGVRPLAPMAGKAELQLVAGEKAFWADVDADTDYMVAPTPGGFESFVQVRSEAAPEQFSLAIDVPQGAELRDLGEQHGVEVVDPARPEKEQVLATISRPMAWDADGSQVEVTYALEDGRLVLRYPHRDKDLHYPLLVDPQVHEDFDEGWMGEEFGWVYQTNNPYLYGSSGNPLVLLGDNVSYPAGASHLWLWQAPGDSFIYRADFVFVDHLQSTPAAPEEQIVAGIFDPIDNVWNWGVGGVREPPNFANQGLNNPWVTTAALTNKYKKICQNWSGVTVDGKPECVPGTAGAPAGTARNMFILQQSWPTSAAPGLNDPIVQMDGAIISLSEFNPPAAVQAGDPAGAEWSDDTSSPAHRSVVVYGDDAGLGIDRFEIDDDASRLDGNGDGIDDDALDWYAYPCTGSIVDLSPCPSDESETLSYQTRPDGEFGTVTNLPEGITRWWGRVIDVVDNVGTSQFPVRIDRSGPTISLSGSLASNPNSPTTDKNLRITVADGTRGGTDAQQRSGVDRVDVLVDGKRVQRFGRDRNEWLLTNSFPTAATGAEKVVRYGDATGPQGELPVVGDWDGDGDDTIGIFRKSGGTFLLRNSNSAGEADVSVGEALTTDLPLSGDWDGDGDDTTGFFRPSNNTFYLRNTNGAYAWNSADITINYGGAQAPYNDVPVVGDWDGDGDDTIGVYRRQTATFLLRNSNGAGSPDITVAYGTPSSPTDDVPVVGDWDGDGDDTIGVFRRSTNTWLLRNSNTAGSAQVTVPFGTGASPSYEQLPVPGDWDDNNTDTPGLQEAACGGDSCPLVRDWAYRLTDQYGGNQEVKVVATDRLGHVSSQVLNVTRPPQGELLDPVDGARTAARLPLRAQLTGGGATTVKFQYRRPLQPWTDLPPVALKDAATGVAASCQSGGATSCVVPLTGGLSPALVVDFTQLPTSFVNERSGGYEVRALFPALGVTKAASIMVDEHGLKAKGAMASAGPGSVDLVTGNFSYGTEDVSFATPGAPLVVSRVHNSRDVITNNTASAPEGAQGPFGPGWLLTAPADDAGGNYAQLRVLPDDPVVGARVEVVTSDGSTITFFNEDGEYDPEDGYESLALTKPATDRYELKDSGGNTVVFTKVGTDFVPTEVKPPAAGQAPDFKYLYHYEVTPSGRPRLRQVIAPREAGVTCTPGQFPNPGFGCRALNFTYAPNTTATTSTLGDYKGRLKSVATVSTVPNGSTPPQYTAETVASYNYDDLGLLREAWDPRLSTLRETYTYDTSSGRLLSIKPPGENQWNVAYQALGSSGSLITSDTDGGRLQSVSRSTPEGVLTTTVAYRVPLTTGAGGPYAMGKTDVAGWGQVTDWPIDATAIYPPGVAATQPKTKAVVHYLGRRGQEVNTAAPGGGKISTSEYDAKGNVIRELSAANRLRVLAAPSKAGLIDIQRTYSADGERLLEELGPEHEIRNGSGVVNARSRTVTTYDEGAPPARFGEAAPNLPTTITTSAVPAGGGAAFDARTTKTYYDWNLRQPTKTVIDPAGQNIARTTIYDKDTGRVLETRAPNAPSHDPLVAATTAHSTKTLYYTAQPVYPPCFAIGLVGMPCLTKPAVQPGAAGLPDLPETTYNYNHRLQPTTTTEKVAGSTARTTTVTYDTAGRQDSQTTTAPVKQPDLVGAYNFDEGSGSTLTDRSATGNNGTLQNGPTWSAGGKYGGALSFDGVNDRVLIPDSPSLRTAADDDFTVEMWVRPATLPPPTNIQVGMWGTGHHGGSGYIFNNKVVLRKAGVNDVASSTSTVAINQWYHLAWTKNGSATRVYIDGADVTGTVSNLTLNATTDGLTIGSNGSYNDKFFNGLIDDVRIYNRALGASEIYSDRSTAIPNQQTSTVSSSTGYSSTTGRPILVASGGNMVQTEHDSVGRIKKYTDAGGNETDYTYDPQGRLSSVDDGKGTQTRTYDPTTGLLTNLSDTQAGTFTASYNADGAITSQTYPGGIQAATTYDETGAAVELAYTKTTNCSSNCLWLRDKVRENVHGQWLWEDSNLSHQDYSYDNVGRLTEVKDTWQGDCKTRSYTYDKDSNRKTKKTLDNPTSAACGTTEISSSTSNYDAADRLTGTGVVYDELGRMASVPSSHSGGGTLSTTYYANDMVRSQTQDNTTKSWLLDPTGTRHYGTVPNGNAREWLHYSDDSDSPAWTEHTTGSTFTSWSRNIEGIDGGLAATYDYQTSTSTGTTTLQLSNLHGDIVATASNSSTATGLSATFEADEFGNPRSPSNRRYGWLGGQQRRTELASGVIQMGVRSYVPAMGRFTSVDSVAGGSASDYDYSNADPVNNLDLDGRYSCKAKIRFKRKNTYKSDNGEIKQWLRMSYRFRCTGDDVQKMDMERSVQRHIAWAPDKTVNGPWERHCDRNNPGFRADGYMSCGQVDWWACRRGHTYTMKMQGTVIYIGLDNTHEGGIRPISEKYSRHLRFTC